MRALDLDARARQEGKRAAVRADREIQLPALMRAFGVQVDDVGTYRRKMRCPFGWLHGDGGVEPSFRLYGDTNTGFCFNGCGLITPVRFAAECWDVPWYIASVRLCAEHLGEDLEADSLTVPAGPASDLMEALRVRLRTEVGPDWLRLQYHQQVQKELERWAPLAEAVTTEAEARIFLARAATAINKVVNLWR